MQAPEPYHTTCEFQAVLRNHYATLADPAAGSMELWGKKSGRQRCTWLSGIFEGVLDQRSELNAERNVTQQKK